METEIGENVSKVKVSGNSFSSTREGPSGTEYVFNYTGVEQDPFGVWNFSISNANDFPVSFNWSATVYSDVYPQDFGVDLSTSSGNVSYSSPDVELRGLLWLSVKEDLEGILDGAPVAYLSPNGIEFVRVNVTVEGAVAGSVVFSGLRVRYYYDIDIEGPAVLTAMELYRAANEDKDTVEVPIAVLSSSDARVLLSDPHLLYDLRPTFTAATQVIEEDGEKTVDLDTMFGDDYDNNNLTYEVVSISQPENLTATIDGNMLTMVPAADYDKELPMTVKGTDSSGLAREGTFQVVVTPVNDPPVVDLPGPIQAQARVPKEIDLADHITDVDTALEALVLSVNTSFVTLEGLLMNAIFDDEGPFVVNLTIVDGEDVVYHDIEFEVSAAVGFPSISPSLQSVINVHLNRKATINLLPLGSDNEDEQEELVWSVKGTSDLFDAVVDGFILNVTPKGNETGEGNIFLYLKDTDGNEVSKRITVNVTERQLEAPRIDTDSLPDKIRLELDDDPYVLDLSDFVEDDTPVLELDVITASTQESIVYIDVQLAMLSFVPKEEGITTVTVTLIDSDSLSSDFQVDVEVYVKEDDDETNWWLIVLILVVLAAIVTVALWPRGRPEPTVLPSKGKEAVPATAVQRIEKVQPHVFRSRSLPQLESVILLHSSGKVISQYTRHIREGFDADLEAAVISAIREHLKGRMRTREEPPDLIELEGMRVVIERGADVALAAVLSGQEPDSLRKLLRRSLNEVQIKNEAILRDWDGDIGSLRGVDNAMVGLVESLIRESNGALDLAVDGEDVGGEPSRREPAVVDGVPPLEDEEEPLKLVKDIIGEQKAKELEEGHHERPEGEEEAEGEKEGK
jgi:hypothetical protein